MDNLPQSWKVRPPQVRVYSHSVENIEDVPMRVVVLECGHIIIRAPEWSLRECYECTQCYALILKETGGRL